MQTTEPRTTTGLYEVHDVPGERVCHIIGDDGGWLCGGKAAPGPEDPPLRTHITRHPGDPVCDGCGLPRWPALRRCLARRGAFLK